MYRRIIVASLLAVALLGSAAAPWSPEECPLDEARAWVAANPNDLPTTLEGIERFAVPYRRAIFEAAPPEVRITLWTENLDAVRSRHADLPAEELSFLSDLTRQLPTLIVDEPDRMALEQLRDRAVEVLGKDIAFEAIAMIGGGVTLASVAADAVRAECGCSFDSEWCGVFQDCWQGGCEPSDWGCGTLWLYECDGVCNS